MDPNPHSGPSLAVVIAHSLPVGADWPQIKSTYDAIAVAVHAARVVVGYRLVGLSEDDEISE